MEKGKRNRPFTATECNKLLELLDKYKSDIENKKSDVETTKIKDAAWAKVANEFNATNEICRDIKELKTKYKNIRYATKSKMATERRNLYGTGGGPATLVVYTAQEEACRNMLPVKEAHGVDNAYDADVLPFDEGSPLRSPTIKSPPAPKQMAASTPASGPATLRAPISAGLKVPNKNTSKTSWSKLAEIKAKWAEIKMDADLEYAKRALEQMEERHKLEMEILEIRLETEKLMLEKAKSNL